MKIRESGMPKQEMWESLFNVEAILSNLEINSQINDIAEIGCGYGTFTIPVSKKIKGVLHAFDIEQEMIEFVRNRARCESLGNIKLYNKDVISETTGLRSCSVDYVMLFNILHHERPDELLNESYRILRQGGKVGIIHWRSDIETPRGPQLAIRPTPEQCKQLAIEAGFAIYKESILEPYHYGITVTKF